MNQKMKNVIGGENQNSVSRQSHIAITTNTSPQPQPKAIFKRKLEKIRSNSNEGMTNSKTQIHYCQPEKAFKKMKQSTTLSPFNAQNSPQKPVMQLKDQIANKKFQIKETFTSLGLAGAQTLQINPKFLAQNDFQQNRDNKIVTNNKIQGNDTNVHRTTIKFKPFMNNTIGNMSFQSNYVPLLSPVISESDAQHFQQSKRATDTISLGQREVQHSSVKLDNHIIAPASLKYAIISSVTNLVDEDGDPNQNGPPEQSDQETIPKTALVAESSIQTKVEPIREIDIAAVTSSGFASPNHPQFFIPDKKDSASQIDDPDQKKQIVKNNGTQDGPNIFWDSPTFANTIYSVKKNQDFKNETLLNFAQTGMTSSKPLNNMAAYGQAQQNKLTIDDIMQSNEKIEDINLTTLEDQKSVPTQINDKFRGISKLTIKSKKNNGSSTSRVGMTQWSEQGKQSAFGITKMKQIKQQNRQKFGLLTTQEMQEIQRQKGQISEEQSFLFNSTMKSHDEFMSKVIPIDHQNFYPTVKIGAFQYTNSQFSESPSKMKFKRNSLDHLDSNQQTFRKNIIPEQMINQPQFTQYRQNYDTQQKFKNYKIDYDFIDDNRHQLNNMNDHQLRFGKDRFEDLKKAFLSQTVQNPCLFPTVSPVSYKAQSEIQSRANSQLQKYNLSNTIVGKIDADETRASIFNRKHQSFSHSPNTLSKQLLKKDDPNSPKHMQFEDYIVGQVGKKSFLLPNLFNNNQTCVADQYIQQNQYLNSNVPHHQHPLPDFEDNLNKIVVGLKNEQNQLLLPSHSSRQQILNNLENEKNSHLNSFDNSDRAYFHSRLRKLHSKYNSKKETISRDFVISEASSAYKTRQMLNPKFNLYGKYGKRINSVLASNTKSNMETNMIYDQIDQAAENTFKDNFNQVAESHTQNFNSAHNSMVASNQTSQKNLILNSEAQQIQTLAGNYNENMSSEIQLVNDNVQQSLETNELTKDIHAADQTIPKRENSKLQVLIHHRKSNSDIKDHGGNKNQQKMISIDNIIEQNDAMNSYSPSIQNIGTIDGNFAQQNHQLTEAKFEDSSQIFPAPQIPRQLSEIQDEEYGHILDQNSSQMSKIDRVRAVNHSQMSNYGQSNQNGSQFALTKYNDVANSQLGQNDLQQQDIQTSNSRLERALQAKKLSMEKDKKQLQLYKSLKPDQFKNKENKKTQILKNEIKQKQLEQLISLECQNVVQKCSMLNQVQQIINCPSKVNSDDILHLLKLQNIDHIESYKKLQHMPTIYKQKQFQEYLRATRLSQLRNDQLEQQFNLHQQIQQQNSLNNQNHLNLNQTLNNVIDPHIGGIHAVASQQSLLAASPSNQTYQMAPSSTIQNYKVDSPIQIHKYDQSETNQPARTNKTHMNESDIDNVAHADKDLTETTPANSKLLNSHSGLNLKFLNNEHGKPSQKSKMDVNPDIKIDDQDQNNDQQTKFENMNKQPNQDVSILNEKTYHLKTEGQLNYVSSRKSLNKHRIQRVRPPDQVMIETGKHLPTLHGKSNNEDINGEPANFDRFSVGPEGNVEYKVYYIQELGKFSVPYLNNVVHNHYNHMRPEKTQRLKNIQSIIPQEKREILKQYREMEGNEKVEVVNFKFQDLQKIGQQFDQAYNNQVKNLPKETAQNTTPLQNNALPSPSNRMIIGNKFENSPTLNSNGSSQKYFKFPLQNSNMTSAEFLNSKTHIIRNEDSKTFQEATYDFGAIKEIAQMPQESKALEFVKGNANQQSQNIVDSGNNKQIYNNDKLISHSPSVVSESKTITHLVDKTKTEHNQSRPMLDSSRLTLQYKQSHQSFIN